MMALPSLITIPYRINRHFLLNDGITHSASFYLFLLPSRSFLIPTMQHCMPCNETLYCCGFFSKASVTVQQMLHGWCRDDQTKWQGTALNCVHHAHKSSSLLGLWCPVCDHSASDHPPSQRGAFALVFVSSSIFMALTWIVPVVSACVVQVWLGTFTSISFAFALSLAVTSSGGPTSCRETSEGLQWLLEQSASHVAAWD